MLPDIQSLTIGISSFIVTNHSFRGYRTNGKPSNSTNSWQIVKDSLFLMGLMKPKTCKILILIVTEHIYAFDIILYCCLLAYPLAMLPASLWCSRWLPIMCPIQNFFLFNWSKMQDEDLPTMLLLSSHISIPTHTYTYLFVE